MCVNAPPTARALAWECVNAPPTARALAWERRPRPGLLTDSRAGGATRPWNTKGECLHEGHAHEEGAPVDAWARRRSNRFCGARRTGHGSGRAAPAGSPDHLVPDA